MTSEAPRTGADAAARITVDDVKASFNNRVQTQIFVRWFARPVAIYLTPWVHNVGLSANAVTLIRCAMNIAAIAALVSGWIALLPAVAISVYLNLVLDCVDGNLARMSGTVTYWGKFFDTFADRIFSLLAPAAAGFALWRHGAVVETFVVGAVVCIIAVYAEMMKSRVSHYREWMVRQSGPLNDAESNAQRRWAGLETHATRLVYNGTFLAPLLLFVPDGLTYYFWVLVPVQGVGGAMGVVAYLGQAWTTMRRSRTSIHSKDANSASVDAPNES